MNKYLIILLYIISFNFVGTNAQDSINIEYCLEKARIVHPLQANQQVINQISNNNILNAKVGFLPQVELNGSATYQSDVVNIDLDMPIPGVEFPLAPKDQYKISFDVSQVIYDGGLSKKGQSYEKAKQETDLAQLEVDIHNNLVQVMDIYFSILLLQENEKSLNITLDQLYENNKIIDSGIKHGVALQTDADLLLVEEINLEQKISELRNSREAKLKVLGQLIGEHLDTSVYFERTNYNMPENLNITRREKIVFDLRKSQIEQNKSILKSRKLPMIYGFGQFGYGNPGLNMLNDKFDTYYLVGARLKWDILDWNTNNRNRRNLELQQKLIENSKRKFDQDINSAILNQQAIVENHIANIDKFVKILALRSQISSKFKAQLNEGIIKTIDLVSAVNNERIARIQLESEKILLQWAIAKYLDIKGDF